ncbi:DUF6384 family protein [Pseudomonas sp. 2835]|uniref:DUF6384 family protein n=1 Tax=Pseudomonas sp. 2835 TaxID=3156451 RepID=UPI003D224D45
MKKPLISEHLGAMALVDEMRHQQLQLKEHLDLPRRQAEVAERIRTHYLQQGIQCDDELVEQGVHDFFARRLEFEAPDLAWHEKLLARILMARRSLAHLVLVALLASALFELAGLI